MRLDTFKNLTPYSLRKASGGCLLLSAELRKAGEVVVINEQADLLSPSAVSYEGDPLPFVLAVSHKELFDIQGLHPLLGSLCLYPCDQNFPLQVHL